MQTEGDEVSDTPRTDDVAMSSEDYEAMYEHAQRLERELTEANLRCAEKAGEAAGLRIQLTAARAEIERLRGEIRKAYKEGSQIGSGPIPRAALSPDYLWDNSRAKRVMEGKE